MECDRGKSSTGDLLIERSVLMIWDELKGGGSGNVQELSKEE